MGKAVLASQFVSGLRPEIKLKVAGTDGDIQQLLVKARFEEARLRDLSRADKAGGVSSTSSVQKKGGPKPPQKPQSASQQDQPSVPKSADQGLGPRCYNCHSRGHLARDCKKPKRRSVETPGRTPGGKVAAIGVGEAVPVEPNQTSPSQSHVEDLRRQLQEAEVGEALAEVRTTLHGIRPPQGTDKAVLGPTITREIELEGNTVQALLDTGSPVTIASLEWLLQALAKKCPSTQGVDAWEEEVKAHLAPPSVCLQGYGGTQLNIIGQIHCQISCGGYS